MSDGLTLSFPLQARVDCLGAAAAVRREASRFGWPVVAAQELAILVAELCNNAVRHGGGGACTTTVSSRRVEVEVTDRGPGFPAPMLTGAPVAPEAKRGGLGEGLASARRLCTTLTLQNPSSGGARAVAVRLVT